MKYESFTKSLYISVGISQFYPQWHHNFRCCSVTLSSSLYRVYGGQSTFNFVFVFFFEKNKTNKIKKGYEQRYQNIFNHHQTICCCCIKMSRIKKKNSFESILSIVSE